MFAKTALLLWADVSASAVREPNGKAQSTVAVIVDITARKKVEEALQKSNEALEQLVDQRTKALSVANAELKGEIERRKGLEGEILSMSRQGATAVGSGIARWPLPASHGGRIHGPLDRDAIEEPPCDRRRPISKKSRNW